MFGELAGHLTASARLINQLFAEPHRLDHFVIEIKKVEHAADAVTQDVIRRINESFVTPIDREDIHLLATRLDTVIDLIDGTARRAKMYHITGVREPARQLTDVLIRSGDCIAMAVGSIKKPKVVIERSREIKRLEEEGDAIYNLAVGDLFDDGLDAIEVIKWKDLYDKLEDALDQCEDVANALESISLKHA